MFAFSAHIVFLCACACALLTDVADGQAVPSIACPQYFRYEQCDFEICGLITLPPLATSSLNVNVGFSLPKYIRTNNWGQLTPLSEQNMINGLAMQYRVSFPVQNPIPKLTSLIVNDQELTECKAPQYPVPHSNFHLLHTLRVANALMYNNNQQIGSTFQFNGNNLNTNRDTNWNPMVTYISGIDGAFDGNIESVLGEVLRGDRNRGKSPGTVLTLEPTFVERPQIQRRPTFMQQTTTTPIQPPAPPTRGFAPVFNVPQLPNTQIPHRNNNDLDYSECGKEGTESAISPYIHNGDLFPRGQFPWLAVIYRKDITGLNFTCGGTIISKRSVITAAHCFMIHKYTANKIVVYLGRHDLESYTDEELETRDVQTLLPHPDFSTSVMADADIALIQLREPIE